MEPVMVFKVKYGEILRRFSVRILENNQLDIDINGLKTKVSSLFNFSPDTDITLTYIDEDGDIVTLVNDEDLYDVMRQQLKFLRIDVHLRDEKNGKPNDTSSRSSTPLSSRERRPSFQGIGTRIAEGLQSLPDPIPESLELLLNCASKSLQPNHVLAELIQGFIQLGTHKHLNPATQSSSVPDNVSSVSPMDPLGANLKYSKDDDVHQEGGPKSKSNGSASMNGKMSNNGNTTKNIGIDAPAPVDLNVLPTDHTAPMHNSPEFPPISHADDNFISECPFSGVSVAAKSFRPPITTITPVSCGNGHTEARGTMFHKGVICDGCGAHPIMGSRFKSKVREDYDLCAYCFTHLGDENDYIRMDHPVYRHSEKKACHRRQRLASARLMHMLTGQRKQSRLDSHFVLDINVLDGTVMAPCTPFTKIWRLQNNGGMVWPRGTQLVWTGGQKMSDAVSVEVEVPADGLPVGSELDIAVDFASPLNPGRYISYWSMASPSGQKFGQRVWVLIQVVAVTTVPFPYGFEPLDLNLPPIGCGLKGPEDVDANPSPATGNGDLLHPCNPTSTAEPVKPDHGLSESEKELQFPINDALLVGQKPGTPADDASSTVSYPAIDSHEVLPSSKAPSVFYPIINFSETIPEATPPPKQSSVPLASSENIPADNVVEETLLTELYEMGFKHVELNKRVLKMNEYDLEKSVDELCGVAEWDPILEELEEMGFTDKVMNKRLLMKNNGSMKRVVMELIGGSSG